ncbi:TetR/AcrR family transcriptional regulator [Rothia sp. CCM 9417]|uniref:TetR/AcrR family transcriptional regulator n=1 Tax=unclassified Rothia (in: high G+C Gram-positive bacteria) TaxID=2689056 RepID=UPI003AE37049
MPKLIDHEARNRVIAQALWKLLNERGVSAVTVRNVAAEAGISMGSLRHSFNNRVELLTFAFDLIGQETEASMKAVSVEGQDVLNTVKILEHFLPITPRSQAISRITLSMVSELRPVPGIKDISTKGLERIRSYFYNMLVYLDSTGQIKTGTHLKVQANKLTTLSYGLSTKAVIGGRGSEPVNISRIFRSCMNEILVTPVAYATQEDIDEFIRLSEGVGAFRS